LDDSFSCELPPFIFENHLNNYLNQLMARTIYLFRIAVLSLISLFLHSSMFSQQVVNTTGNTIGNSSISIEYSVREIATITLSSNDNYITQGVLQPIIKIDADPCKILQFIPNAFTPNGDGINDCFGVSQWPFTSSFELSIYTRWGQLVFKTTDINGCWDGKFGGRDQGIGGFVYMIKAVTTCGPVFLQGSFALLR
jgi:gliding motility-associated-like protein